MVEYEYDPDGRLVRALVTREPEFTSEDVDLLISHQNRSIGPHGFPMEEALSSDADPNNPDGSYLYRARAPFIDFAAKAQRDMEAKYRKDYPDEDLSYWVFPVEKVPRKSAALDAD